MKAKISQEQKEKILKESYEEGVVITELGKKYGISKKTIYDWRRIRNKDQRKNSEQQSKVNFVEIALKDEVRSQLKKVELVYEDFRIEVEGKISSAKIGPIMQILEDKC